MIEVRGLNYSQLPPPKKRPKYSAREIAKIVGACLFALLIGGMIAIIPILGFEMVISAIEHLHRH